MTHRGVRVALEAQRRPADYIDAIREHGVGWLSETPLNAEEAADEMLMMGLRVSEGIEIARLETLRGRLLNTDALGWLVEQGLVAHEAGHVRLTHAGRVLANRIAAELAV
jgi:oxygen-independent coproporphyrinogen-3 oxidase